MSDTNTKKVDTQDKIASIVSELAEKLGIDPDTLLNDDKFDMSYFRLPSTLKKHLRSIIKDRSIILTGDTDHLTIDHIVNTMFADIDKPREYDFQDEDVHEQECIQSLERMVNDFLRVPDRDQFTKALAGEEWFVAEGGYDNKCYDCAEKLGFRFKGNEVHLLGAKPCANNRKFTVEVDFPTGEVVFGDWPDRFSELTNAGILDDGGDGESINYLKGQRQRSDVFARQRIFHQSVGNSSPTWFYNDETAQIRIGGSYNEDTDEVESEAGFKEMGYFCTDLWWVTMLDKKYYDSMIVKLSETRNKKYYSKKVETGKIKPGKYRFTCHSRGDDDAGVYTTAEWIGEADQSMPTFDVMDGYRIPTVAEAITYLTAKHSYVYGKGSNAKFRLIDYAFNVIGNGINSIGDFFTHVRVPKDEVIEPYDLSGEQGFGNPYPNFNKQYTFVWDLYQYNTLDQLPTEWLEANIWYFEKSREYFLNDPQDYSYAYPGKRKRDEDEDTRMLQALAKIRQETNSEEEFQAKVKKDYTVEFNGDLPTFYKDRWENRKEEYVKFIDETLTMLNKELDSRK
jgi:hypothetical protein